MSWERQCLSRARRAEGMAGRSLGHRSVLSGLRVDARTGEVWGAGMASVEPELHPLLYTVPDSVRGSKMQLLAAG